LFRLLFVERFDLDPETFKAIDAIGIGPAPIPDAQTRQCPKAFLNNVALQHLSIYADPSVTLALAPSWFSTCGGIYERSALFARLDASRIRTGQWLALGNHDRAIIWNG
jgi:hypothetical protein